jgi:hypothetical protein
MPSHRTPANAKIGDSRRADGGHVAGVHIGKGGSQPMSLKRRDSDFDLRPPSPEDTPRPAASVVVGENPGIIQDRRR